MPGIVRGEQHGLNKRMHETRKRLTNNFRCVVLGLAERDIPGIDRQ